MTHATRVLVNGKIWCGLKEGFAEALAIAGDKVMLAGSRAEIDRVTGPETQVIDLGGKLAIPGLNDAHLHLHMYGRSLIQLDLRPEAGITTVEQIVDLVRVACAAARPGQWVLGRGYDHDKLVGGRHPTMAELDTVSPDNPVLLTRTCGHTVVANQRAMTAGGIDENTPAPFGGKIGYTDDGALNGLLWENARDPIKAAIPDQTLDDLVDAIERGGKKLLSLGVTSVMEAAIGIEAGETELDAYLAARAAGRIPVRVSGTIMGDITRSIVDYASSKGLITGAGDDMFRIGAVKIFTDGSAGAGTAWYSEPYYNAPDSYGVRCLTQEQTDELVLKAHRLGYQMAPHAIGDAAISMVLNAYEKAYAEIPAPDRRHRIEHCGWHKPEDLARMKAMGVIPAGQAPFLYYFGDGYFTLFGPDRPHHAYPFKTWLAEGLHLSASTDCPVTSPDPRAGLYAMVARKTEAGRDIGAAEALSMAEALHLYTYEAAYGMHDEDRKGRLIPGQYADVTVFDADLFTIPADAILNAQCVMTLLGGEIVYRAEDPCAV